MNPLWSHQQTALDSTEFLINEGVGAICVTSPTGGGKTRLEIEEIIRAKARHWPVALYTNRCWLMEQTERVLKEHGIEPGLRASGCDTHLLRDVQLCMTQTEGSQVLKIQSRELHDARIVLVDEAHIQKGAVMEEIIRRHREAGATIIGYTATPLDIGHIYDELVIAGTNAELRKCGAHVPCMTFAPDEPDLKKIGPVRVGEDLSESQNKKAMMRPGIFGRVFSEWKKLNPDARPAILFAPGVAESLWFAEQFLKEGIPAAHIDHSTIWINGDSYNSDEPGLKQDLLGMSESGEVKVICNRFVMREGIDAPWLYHCIMATVFGSLTSYLQAGGRLLRAHPSLGQVVLQDHGGNWHRHGSLNADRQWRLEYTNAIACELRAERLRERKDPEPICCPQCFGLRLSGPICPHCNHRCERRSRMVVQHDGTLKAKTGDIYRPRTVRCHSDTRQKWDRMYFRAHKSDMTFRQAEALFFVENHYYPPRTLQKMPVRALDWFLKVKDVPKDRLTKSEVTA